MAVCHGGSPNGFPLFTDTRSASTSEVGIGSFAQTRQSTGSGIGQGARLSTGRVGFRGDRKRDSFDFLRNQTCPVFPSMDIYT